MGLGRDGIMRFPRLIKKGMRDSNGHKLTIHQRLQLKFDKGIVPHGYNSLTKRHKKLARLIVDGMTIKEACKKVGVDDNTYYRWMHFHIPFRKYYHRYAEEVSGLNEIRLRAKVGRAVNIVEESMENPDPYFRHEVAHKHLTGMGFYKKHGETNKNVKGTVKIDGTVKHTGKPIDKDLLAAFVTAMTGMATGGGKLLRPKIIDVEVVKKELAENSSGGVSEVQEEAKKTA